MTLRLKPRTWPLSLFNTSRALKLSSIHVKNADYVMKHFPFSSICPHAAAAADRSPGSVFASSRLLLVAAAFLAVFAPTLQADEVALMRIKMADKSIHPVAIEFYEGDAPATVGNFKKLAHKKFYNGLAFHRVFPHTLVQVGDPLTAHSDRANVGTGGPGYTLLPEIHRKHIAGAIAMARLPDKINPSRMSNGSQFFVCLKAMPEYDGHYTVFGHVLYGMDTLDAISARAADSNDNPIDRVTIKTLRILPREQLPGAPVPPKPGTPTPAKKPWWKLF